MRLTKDVLAKLLRMAADRVEAGDSMEGSLVYVWIERDDYQVGASIRHGNREGQGFVTLVQYEEPK